MFSFFLERKKKEDDVGDAKSQKFIFKLWDTDMAKEINKFVPLSSESDAIKSRNTKILHEREKTLVNMIYEMYRHTYEHNGNNPLFDNCVLNYDPSDKSTKSPSTYPKMTARLAKKRHAKKKTPPEGEVEMDPTYELREMEIVSPLDELVLVVWTTACLYMVYGLSEMDNGRIDSATKAFNSSAGRYEWLATVTKTQGAYDYTAWDFLHTRAYVNKGLEFWCRACISACDVQKQYLNDDEDIDETEENRSIDFHEMIPRIYWTLEFLRTALLLFKNNTGKDDAGDTLIHQVQNQIYLWEKWHVFCVLGHIYTKTTNRRKIKKKVVANMNIVISDIAEAAGTQPSTDHLSVINKMKGVRDMLARNLDDFINQISLTQNLQTLYIKNVIGEDVYNSDVKMATMIKDSVLNPVKSALKFASASYESLSSKPDAFSFVHPQKIAETLFLADPKPPLQLYPRPTEQGKRQLPLQKLPPAKLPLYESDSESGSGSDSDSEEEVSVPQNVSELKRPVTASKTVASVKPLAEFEDDDDDEDFEDDDDEDEDVTKIEDDDFLEDDEMETYETSLKKNEEIVIGILKRLEPIKRKLPLKTYTMMSLFKKK